MIRTLEQGVNCINSLCGNYPRFTLLVDEEKFENNKVNCGVCRLFLKDKVGEYTIPTPFFGFWSGYFAGEREFEENDKRVCEEYYELCIAGDCIHNFVNRRLVSGMSSREKITCAKFYDPIAASYCYYEDNEIVDTEFDGEPIYPDILFSDFIYSTVFNFGKEGWYRFFEMVGKYVFLSLPTWGVVDRNGKFSNLAETEFVHKLDIVKSLKRDFKKGNIIFDNNIEFDKLLVDMCDDCLTYCKCREECLDKLGKWLVFKGYQLDEIEKLYCRVDGYGDEGTVFFERGWGYGFSEIAFTLLKKGKKND